ncbi:hypothetical protein [Massilia sp. CF038]|uniref:hypothetical protein n=1 Tax=Massilia sp. CF038 TaxID=1881045 RepID=UPI000913E028|nr:hypothetical protein [Massilia sp. CF038]SHG39820.1 hypothetical protein SAMN05428948_0261 [Massilia sp. CF038]
MNPFSRLRALSITSLLLASVLCMSGAQAGTASGKVLSVTAGNSILFAFRVGPVSGKASCSPSDDFVIDNSTAWGKAMISVILSAQAQGLTVSVIGTGNCNVWGDRETVSVVTAY